MGKPWTTKEEEGESNIQFTWIICLLASSIGLSAGHTFYGTLSNPRYFV